MGNRQIIVRWMCTCMIILMAWFCTGPKNVSAAERVTVKASIANMRSGPGTGYDVLWQVEKFHPFIVVEKKDTWVKIKDFEGDMAWIHESLLTCVDGVITSKTNGTVRSEPSTASSITFTVESWVPFRESTRQAEWIHIEHADVEHGGIYDTYI